MVGFKLIYLFFKIFRLRDKKEKREFCNDEFSYEMIDVILSCTQGKQAKQSNCYQKIPVLSLSFFLK